MLRVLLARPNPRRGSQRGGSAALTASSSSTASYGSLARFKDIVRLHPIGETTLLGASGDMADFQQVKRLLENLMCVRATRWRDVQVFAG